MRSPGAQAIRLQISDANLGRGILWIRRSAADADPLGAYTGKGPTLIVDSDAVTLEFEKDPAASVDDTLPFRVSGISHIWASPTSSAQPEAVAHVLDAAASCNLDATCYSDWATSENATPLIVFELDDGTYSCSGVLMNSKDRLFTPYFLTANHCIGTDKAARSVAAYWYYQTSTCNGPAPRLSNAQQLSGAQLLLTRDGGLGDFSLLKLSTIPDDAWFMGWTTEEPDIGNSITGIHHPKRCDRDR